MQAKHTLSNTYETDIAIESLSGDHDYEMRLSRVDLERICETVFLRCIAPLLDALESANLA